MRWPWRRADQPVREAVPPPPPPAGWAFLPPLQRQVADAAPATLRPGFVASLPTRSMPSSLTTMSHLLDDGAPAGTFAIDGAAIGVPVRRVSGSELSLRATPPAARASVSRMTTASSPTAPVDAPPTPPAAVSTDASGPAPLPAPEREASEPDASAASEPVAEFIAAPVDLSMPTAPTAPAAVSSTRSFVQRTPAVSTSAPVQRRVGLGAPLAPSASTGRAAETAPPAADATATPVPAARDTATMRVPASSVSRLADVSSAPRSAAADLRDLDSPRARVTADGTPAETAPILMHSSVLGRPETGVSDEAATPASVHAESVGPPVQRVLSGPAHPPLAVDPVQRATADVAARSPSVDDATLGEANDDVWTRDERSAPSETISAGVEATMHERETAPVVAADAVGWSPPLPLRSVPIVASRALEPSIGVRPLGRGTAGGRGMRVVAARAIAPGEPARPIRASSARQRSADVLQRVPDALPAAATSPPIAAPPLASTEAGVPASTRRAPAPEELLVQRAFGLPSLPSSPSMPRVPSTPGLPSPADLPAWPGQSSMPDLPSVPDLPARLPSADALRERAAEAIPDLTKEATDAADAARSSVSQAVAQAGQALSGIGGAPASALAGSENVEQFVRTLYGPLVRRIKAELLLDRERRGIRIDGI